MRRHRRELSPLSVRIAAGTTTAFGNCVPKMDETMPVNHSYTWCARWRQLRAMAQAPTLAALLRSGRFDTVQPRRHRNTNEAAAVPPPAAREEGGGQNARGRQPSSSAVVGQSSAGAGGSSSMSRLASALPLGDFSPEENALLWWKALAAAAATVAAALLMR